MLTFAPAECPQLYQSPVEKTAGVRRAEFEGGYSQRSGTGPNAIVQSVPVQWDVPADLADYIDSFLTDRRGVEAFRYQLPWAGKELIWSCAEWNRSPLGYLNGQRMWRIRATFRQEFDIV
ncbi:phage tail protein [Candidatus Rhodobacter oscarellae]|uniref:phage tail protein n=1 Tax=Candidatus Rhodobacter oscarellae TaxID=1675527 RepID=UPI0009E2C71D|nr:phage tail protein [Candidatus Rhodobacter lobularis]